MRPRGCAPSSGHLLGASHNKVYNALGSVSCFDLQLLTIQMPVTRAPLDVQMATELEQTAKTDERDQLLNWVSHNV